MDELISKEMARRIIDSPRNKEQMLRMLKSIPSVEPKREQWIHVGEEMWKCDQCGEISCCSPKYCPDCGSRNEVTE